MDGEARDHRWSCLLVSRSRPVSGGGGGVDDDECREDYNRLYWDGKWGNRNG